MNALSHHIVVAGVGGGVGTTTVASLLFASLAGSNRGAPRLLDHSDGELGLRLPEGDEVTTIDPSYAIHDLGAHAATEGLELLARPEVLLVVVAAATRGGVAVAERLLSTIRDQAGAGGLSRTRVAFVGVFGRHRIHRDSEGLQDRFGRNLVVLLPQDTALAAGGRIPTSRQSHHTRAGVTQLVRVITEAMALQRSAIESTGDR